MMIETIRSLYNLGLLAVPTKFGTRTPSIPYSHWRQSFPTQREYFDAWASLAENSYPQILCGIGNIAVIDVDRKNKDCAEEIMSTLVSMVPSIIDKSYLESTGTGGYHLWFKTNTTTPTRSLARVIVHEGGVDKKKPFIELLGDGHLCRCFPGDGITPVSGSILQLQTLTDQEFECLTNLLSSFNEVEDEDEAFKPKAPKKPIAIADEDVSPGDDYSSRVDIEEVVGIFQAQGWSVRKSGGRFILRRPGAKTMNFDADIRISSRSFISYSSSVTEFNTGEPYSMFAVYAILKHNGDFSEAAKALKEQGYGSQKQYSPTEKLGKAPAPKIKLEGFGDDEDMDDDEYETADPLWEQIKGSQDDMWSDYTDRPDIVFNQPFTNESYSFASAGESVLIAGREKSRKTVMIATLVSVAKTSEAIIGFSRTSEQTFAGNIVLIDTEQPRKWAKRTAYKIAMQCGYSGDISGAREFLESIGVHYFMLSRINGHKKKMEAIRKVREMIPDIVMLTIDNIKDLVGDFNNVDQSKAVVDEIQSFRGDKCQCLVVTVLHMNKGERSPRGHLGAFMSEAADCILYLTLNEQSNETDVEFARMRDRKPEPFSFGVDHRNMPLIKEIIPGQFGGLTIFGNKQEPAALPSLNPSDFNKHRPTEAEIESLYD